MSYKHQKIFYTFLKKHFILDGELFWFFFCGEKKNKENNTFLGVPRELGDSTYNYLHVKI